MVASEITQPSFAKHSIHPPWYVLREDKKHHPYIQLPPALSSPSIFLTILRASDAEAMQKVLDISSINVSLIAVPKPYTIADANSWITQQLQGTGSPWIQAIRSEDPETGKFIGSVTLLPAMKPTYEPREEDEKKCNSAAEYVLGYYLDPRFHRRGIMRDAVLALLTWASTKKGVTSVRVDVVAENVASRRLVESLDGFVKEESETEIIWSKIKGGGTKKLWTWRWQHTVHEDDKT